VSAQAVMRVASRQDVTHSLFADPEQQYHEAVQFYRHDIDWTNRLILGDSLQVMSSLARREDLAGKVQMIYMDPPYGIKFASNFQPEVGNREVKENDSGLTRELETVRAYRDTWHLGIHSYLSYLRDRFASMKELLAPTGSVFVQIGDENLHRVRNLMDEVFGADNHICVITVEKTSGSTQDYLSTVTDYLLWYARDRESMKFNKVFLEKRAGQVGGTGYTRVLRADGRFESIDAGSLLVGKRVRERLAGFLCMSVARLICPRHRAAGRQMKAGWIDSCVRREWRGRATEPDTCDCLMISRYSQ
jgi:adenine-specific DNA-methyltransferase